MNIRHQPKINRDLLTMYACTSGSVTGRLPGIVEEKLSQGSQLMELNDLMFAFFEMKKFILRLSHETKKDIYGIFMEHLIALDLQNAHDCSLIDEEFGVDPEEPSGPTGIVQDGAVN